MSKICIAVFDAVPNRNALENMIKSLAISYNLGVAFTLAYIEPFLLEISDSNKLICDFSDGPNSDNCELLLLPDGCSFNGNKNISSFASRMMQLEVILIAILKQTDRVDLFIGDSGTALDSFEEYTFSICDLLKNTGILNTIAPPDVHFRITR